MSIIDYLKINKVWLFNNLGIFVIFNLILISSTDINKSYIDIFYMDMLLVFIIACTIFYGYFRTRNKYKLFTRSIKEIYSMERELKSQNDFFYNEIIRIFDEIKKIEAKEYEEFKKSINDMEEYITQWVHDIKVNVATNELLIQEIDYKKENVSKLKYQMEQLKFKINGMLQVTRSNHYSNDIISEEFDLEAIVRKSIRENAIFFINKNIEIDTSLRPYNIVSDKKWVEYIIVQILNNCSKYSSDNGYVKIFTKENEKGIFLHIIDNGKGIPKEELHRVFEKSFTGINGREGTKSTGMGLYYAKKMSDKLNIGLTINSIYGESTEAIISFYKLDDYFNITKMSH